MKQYGENRIHVREYLLTVHKRKIRTLLYTRNDIIKASSMIFIPNMV